MTLAAIRADAAGNSGVERDAVALAPACHLRAGGDDFAGGFVTHDKWRPAAAGRAVPAVDVAPANPAGADPEQNVVGGGLRLGKISELEVGRSGENQGFRGKEMNYKN